MTEQKPQQEPESPENEGQQPATPAQPEENKAPATPPKMKAPQKPAEEAPAPKIRLKQPTEKGQTSRIDLEASLGEETDDSTLEEEPDLEELREAMKKGTVRIDSAALEEELARDTEDDIAQASKRSTTRIDPPEDEMPDTSEATKKATAKIDVPEETPDTSEASKKATAKIDVPEETPDVSEASKKATARIESPELEEAMKKATSRIEPMETDEAMKKATARIEETKSAPDKAQLDESGPTPEQIEQATKKSTVRIDAVGEDEAGKPSAKDLEEAAKKSTVRIDAESAEPPTDAELGKADTDDLHESAKKATARVQVEDDKKGDTQRVAGASGVKEPAPQGKKQTSRIDIGEVLDEDEEEDIFKRRTAVLDRSKFPAKNGGEGGPRTIRIKRPGGTRPPTTTVLKKPPVEAEPPTVAPETAAAPTVSDAKKSETSRIELPEEATVRPPTRRKTVRIKRPDGSTGSRQMTVARPSQEVDVESGPKAAAAPEKEEIGAVFSALALVAVLVMAVLIYVLAAQSVAQGLPFPSPV